MEGRPSADAAGLLPVPSGAGLNTSRTEALPAMAPLKAFSTFQPGKTWPRKN
jgi:hypothetical protein